LLEVLPDLKAQGFSAAVGEADRGQVASRIRETINTYRLPLDASKASSPEVRTARQSLMEMERIAELLDAPGKPTPAAHSQAAPYLVALQQVMERRFSDAAETLRPIVREHPEFFESTLLLGMLARAQETGDSAESLLMAAAALRPGDFTTMFQRGLYYLKSEQHRLAMMDFESALRIRPEAADAWFALGLAQKGAGQLEDALRSYDKAILHQFPETRIHFAKAELLEQMGRKDEAVLARDAGLKLTPDDDRSWVARGLARLPENPELAAQEIRKAFERNPSSHDAYRNLSMVLSEYLKKPEEALKVLDEAIQFHPQDEFLWAGRGVLHARRGDSKRAVADGQQALTLSSDPFLLYMVACIYSLSSRADPQEQFQVEALKLVAQSLRKDASLATSMQSDPDLKDLHSNSRFQQLLAAAGVLQNN